MVNEHVEFQGDGGSNGLPATQANMTPLHSLDPIRQSVTNSTDRTARAGIGQFLTPVAIAQSMASLFEDGPGHARLLDPGTRRGPALWLIACNEWCKARRFKSAYYLYAVMNAATLPQAWGRRCFCYLFPGAYSPEINGKRKGHGGQSE